MSDLHAAIDIGTNSMHLVVARTGPSGGFEVLTTLKEHTRLGSGAGDMKRLQPDAIDRGIAALRRMVATATSLGAEVAAVATSAVREADNRDEFLDRARREVGIEVEVVSGVEEARLIHLGVLQALAVYDHRLMMVDIGGGSTELLVGTGDQPIEARSMKLGAIRVTDRFFGSGTRRPKPEAVAECRRWLRSALAAVAHELSGHHPEVYAGSSGTITTIAAMCAAARGELPKSLNGATITAPELQAVCEQLVARSAAERAKLPGIDPRRTDILLGGALLLEAVFDTFHIDVMMVSELALREGVLLDRFGTAAHDRQVRDLRRSNVERLARQLDPDPAHGDHIAHLSVQLFDRTTTLHQLDTADRELLDAAARLHNVGLFVSHSSHHKHSYYVVRNSDQLTGFSDLEIETIALLTRYHRKGTPSTKHPEFAGLDKAHRRKVRILAGLLRIAIGLDRRHSGVVANVRVHTSDGRVEIEPVTYEPDDIELELYAARERSDLLAEALGVEVVVAASSQLALATTA